MSKREMQSLLDALNLIVMSGVPMQDGLRALAADSPSSSVSRSLRALADQVQSGEPLEMESSIETLGLSRNLTPVLVAAATSGQFEETLFEWTEHIQRLHNVRRDLIHAMAYPTLVLGLTLLTLFGFVFYIVASFREMMQALDTELPPLTSALTEYFHWWSVTGWKASLVALFVTALTMGILRTCVGKANWAWFLNSIPLFGPLRACRAAADFTGQLSLLIGRSVELPRALEIVAESMSDPNLKQVATRLAHATSQGTSLSKELARSPRVLPTMVPPIEWGERTDALTKGLGLARDAFLFRCDLRTALLNSVLPPVMFVLTGAVMILVLYTVLVPLASLIQNLS